MITRRIVLMAVLGIACAAQTFADDGDDDNKRWAIEVGVGKITGENDGPDNQNFYLNDDEGNHFYANADYWLNRRIALTGGVHFTQMGMATDFASGIGQKKINMFGVQAGAKYYFFPLKWVVQPHVGGMLRTNFLNLGHMTGEDQHVAQEGYPDTRYEINYDVRCPALSLSPRLGADIRLFSSVSLCIDYELQWQMWGHDRYQIRMRDGSMVGQTSESKISRLQPMISLGLKVDFPMRKVSQSSWNTLINVLYSIISSRAD